MTCASLPSTPRTNCRPPWRSLYAHAPRMPPNWRAARTSPAPTCTSSAWPPPSTGCDICAGTRRRHPLSRAISGPRCRAPSAAKVCGKPRAPRQCRRPHRRGAAGRRPTPARQPGAAQPGRLYVIPPPVSSADFFARAAGCGTAAQLDLLGRHVLLAMPPWRTPRRAWTNWLRSCAASTPAYPIPSSP